MSNASDFVIENGVLKKYTGPGGDVVIPAGCTEVNASAFNSAFAVTSVTIPEGVTEIGNSAFRACTKMASIRIPKSVKTIGWHAFEYCTSLTDVMIPGGVTTIPQYAFANCTSLRSMSIPEGVTRIENAAFSNCKRLKSVSIPGTVTEIDDFAFGICESLTDVTIPEGITAIKDSTFCFCEKLESIAIPDSVTSIGKEAFKECKSLTNISLPENLTAIGADAFKGCKKLQDSNGFVIVGSTLLFYAEEDVLKKAGNRMLYSCDGEYNPTWDIRIPDGVKTIGSRAFLFCSRIGRVDMPEGVTAIQDNAFLSCSRMKSIHLPQSLRSIGESAFEGCSKLTELTIPQNVATIESRAFVDCANLKKITITGENISFGSSLFVGCKALKDVVLGVTPNADFKANVFPAKAKLRLPKDALHTNKALPSSLAQKVDFASAEDFAYVAVYQAGKPWMEKCKFYCDFFDDALPDIVDLLTKDTSSLTQAKAKFLIFLITERIDKADQQLMLALLALLRHWAESNKSKAVLKEIADCEAKIYTPEEKHPIEYFVDEELEKRWINPDVQKVVKNGIPYADGSGTSSKNAVALLLAEYQRRWAQTATLIQGERGKVEVLENTNLITISEVADKIAAALDHQELLALLRQLAHGANYRLYILAYARFADEAEMESFIKEISQKLRSVAKDRYWAKNAQQAMYLSETTAAIRYIDRYGKLSQYAMMHNADANTLRIERLYDLGMDETGKKVYDLGGKHLAVQLLPDLTLQLYDENAGKIVKSVPKAGSDERKYNAAKEDLAKLKKDIKEIRDTQFEKLFQAFLNGTGKRAVDWERFYQSNPVLRQIAELVVWAQGADTFTLKQGKLINSAGQEYVRNDCMVTVAHPMEMGAKDVAAWQGYFAANQLKQPFTQIWEPVIDFSKVTFDRYAGIEFPAYRFKGQEKHGITFHFDYGSSELDIGLTDCRLYLAGGTAIGRHTLDLQGSVQLYAFQVNRQSRASNHIIGLLDKWAVYSRILKDDVSIAEQLPQFTLAQIEEFLKLAMENNSTNCTAALLAFKNANFAGFDPMEEFTLEL